MALVEALISSTLAAHGKAGVALRLDHAARIAFPAEFAVVMIVFWTVAQREIGLRGNGGKVLIDQHNLPARDRVYG